MFVRFGIQKVWGLILSLVVLFSAHLAYGANTNALAIIFSLISLLLCFFITVFSPQMEGVLKATSLKIVVLLFSLTLILIALQLTAYLPGGAHPFWEWNRSTKAITLDQDTTVHELIKLIALGAMFMVGIALSANSKQAELFFNFIIIVGAAYSFWMFLEYFSNIPVTSNGQIQGFGRLAARFGSANSAATLFGILSILSIASITRKSKIALSKNLSGVFFVEYLFKHSAISIIALLFTLTSLLLTASRGGISASFIAISILISWEIMSLSRLKNSIGNTYGFFVLIISTIAVVIFMSSDHYIGRMTGAGINSDGRALTFAVHWQAFLANPWSGYGLGSFYLVNDVSMDVRNWGVIYTIGALHNVYLQWLEEAGIIGSTLMFSTIALILWHIYRGLRIRRRMHTWLRAILCISLLLLLHGLVDYGLQVPSIAMTWALLLGVGFSLAMKRER